MDKVERIINDLTIPDVTWRQPCLIATFGFPGAGKTTIASMLSDRYPLVCLSTDTIRLQYGFSSGPETLQMMHRVAETLLAQHQSVIFDGIHMMRKNREELRQFGQSNQAQVRFIHVIADPEVIKFRLEARAAQPDDTAQQGKFVITDEHFQRIISYYEAPDGEADVITVDTSPSSPADKQLKSFYMALDSWLSP